jgi:hypothetical protein
MPVAASNIALAVGEGVPVAKHLRAGLVAPDEILRFLDLEQAFGARAWLGIVAGRVQVAAQEVHPIHAGDAGAAEAARPQQAGQ